jgi:hypothetical protein
MTPVSETGTWEATLTALGTVSSHLLALGIKMQVYIAEKRGIPQPYKTVKHLLIDHMMWNLYEEEDEEEEEVLPAVGPKDIRGLH